MSQLSRADLLRSLKTPIQNEQPLAQALGYAYQPKQAQNRINAGQPQAKQNHGHQALAWPTIKPTTRYWVVVKETTLPAEDEQPTNITEVNTQSTDTLDVEWDFLPMLPIWAAGQWQNCWDKALPSQRDSRQIDMAKTLTLITKSKPLNALPKKHIKSYNQPVQLIVERGEQTKPIWQELMNGWKSLQKILITSQLNTVYLEQGPNGPWRKAGTMGKSSKTIAQDAIVVIIGALGGLKTATPSQQWLKLLTQISSAGHKVLIVSCAPLALPAELSRDCYVIPLDKRSPQAKNSQALVTALSQVWQATPEQIRLLRLNINQASLSDELLMYESTQIEKSGGILSLKEAFILTHLNTVQADAELQKSIDKSKQQWRKYKSKISRELEHLQSNVQKRLEMSAYPELMKAAQCLHAATTETITSTRNWAQQTMLSCMSLNYLLANSNPINRKQWQPYLEQAQKIAQQHKAKLPLQHLGLSVGEQAQALYQVGASLTLRPLTTPQQQGAHLLNVGENPFCPQINRVLPTTIKPQQNELTLIENGKHYALKAIKKPKWADQIWKNKHGLFAAHSQGLSFIYDGQNEHWKKHSNNCTWASDFGIDQYGLWAQISIKNSHGLLAKLTNKESHYRLRWIPANQFEMGSPETEKERYKNETLHTVTLSQGYWLGETSCTQQFWQAVMGDNPSYNKGEELPVTDINWDEAQAFMKKLKSLWPEFTAQLPTEAQWEMACRAGTQTAYWWGDDFSDDYANKSGGIKTEADYPANEWGLKSMSGNVDEWCLDRYDDYGDATTDPIGTTGRNRVLRGGSYFSGARDLRSASRDRFSAGYRGRSIGLRLAAGFTPQASKSAWPQCAGRVQRSGAEQNNAAKRGG